MLMDFYPSAVKMAKTSESFIEGWQLSCVESDEVQRGGVENSMDCAGN